MHPNDNLYLEFAGAFVRGSLGLEGTDLEMVNLGRERGLKLHRFKKIDLPRVKKCVGLLKGLYPETLLDVGTGRGAFLWTLLHEMPELRVLCIDILEHRVKLVNTVHQGGVDRIEAQLADAQELDFDDDSYDMVTALEVLEHMPSPQKALNELARVGKNYLLVSVPSKPDDNPEHIHLFSADDLEEMLTKAGAVSVQLHHVLNHRIALAKL